MRGHDLDFSPAPGATAMDALHTAALAALSALPAVSAFRPMPVWDDAPTEDAVLRVATDPEETVCDESGTPLLQCFRLEAGLFCEADAAEGVGFSAARREAYALLLDGAGFRAALEAALLEADAPWTCVRWEFTEEAAAGAADTRYASTWAGLAWMQARETNGE